MFTNFDKWLNQLLHEAGITNLWIDPLASLIKIIAAFIISYLLFKIAYNVIVNLIKKFTKKTASNWDDIMVEQKVISRITYLIPAYILFILVPIALTPYPKLVVLFQTGLKIYSAIIILITFTALFNAILVIYQQYPISNTRPIKGYIQVAKIILYMLVGITIISYLIGQNPLILLGGLGAFSAVLLLVFKDSILGLVAGIQLTANDMLRNGDWISLPKYDADGTVVDITLTTVKIQNWDKTFSTIPAYSLFSESFKNWRGMEESGGRRIKRSINIDMNSVRFCTPEMLEKFKRIHYVQKYISDKEEEIKKYNEELQIDNEILVNGRRQTNIGVFRNYLYNYLINHPKINPEMTFLVRHLQPTEKGIPIEVYVFSRDQEWANYENLQADIFDHIMAAIPEFELRVFQNPSGVDVREALKSGK
ncbi:MAG TPA: mechanosensitive ion channel [Bacteroidales bacterium]|nr:mechanosensitive ion channel [Bacteroidales bacterium]HPR58173.1 mechanosensitive ion channel [Bacteroidales bacterium]